MIFTQIPASPGEATKLLDGAKVPARGVAARRADSTWQPSLHRGVVLGVGDFLPGWAVRCVVLLAVPGLDIGSVNRALSLGLRKPSLLLLFRLTRHMMRVGSRVLFAAHLALLLGPSSAVKAGTPPSCRGPCGV